MSDQDDATRELASACFGNAIKLLPLEKSAKSPVGFEEAREKERKFVEQLLDSSKVEPFKIPIQINAELRQYQKDGVSWLAFLNKYNLHGILCDDMGLGKTLVCFIIFD
jgi:TATA-binding protein-associated factor